MSISIMTDQQSTTTTTTSSPMKEPKQEIEEEKHEQQVPDQKCCVGCKQLQMEVSKSINVVMQRMDQLQSRLDELFSQNEQKQKEASSSGSSGKVTPSPSISPKLEVVANNGSTARKRKQKERTPPTAASPLPDFSNFVNGLIFDPISMAANQNGMMQLMSLVQQQHQQQESSSPPEAKVVKLETPSTASADESDQNNLENIAAESPEMIASTQNLIDAITAQFSSVAGNTVTNSQSVTSTPVATASSSSTTTSTSSSSAVQKVIEAVATPSRSSQDDDTNQDPSNTVRCSNCATDKTTAWRRDADGKLVCNPCGLYYRLHKVRRPIEMRKNHIQQRYRRKNKDKDVVASFSDPALFNQLLNQMPSMTTGGSNANGGGSSANQALSFLEQITQFTQAHELMNSSATF
uniref:GATA-type domain-containing protein n=2 Tax=Caenorhabditis tropicalis TaxID=1561998 RepID=A0A1I7TQ87_9PELO